MAPRSRSAAFVLVLITLLVAPTMAQVRPPARRGNPKNATIASLLAARTENAKAQVYFRLRSRLGPADVLAIVQHEQSSWIAGMALGGYLEGQAIQPAQAAVILDTFAQRDGSFGLAATQAATCGQTVPIAGALIALGDSRRSSQPKLLAATILAVDAKVSADGGAVAGGKIGQRKPGQRKPGQRKPAADMEPLIAKLLADRSPEVRETAILAAAWGRIARVKDAVMKADSARRPETIAAKMLYSARLGLPVPQAAVEQVFAAQGKTPQRYTLLTPGLSNYDVQTSALCYGCEALGELGQAEYLDYLHEALNDRDLRVQIEAAKAIERIGSPDSVPALIEKIKSYRTPWPVLVHVLSATGAIPAAESVPVLIDRLSKETGRFRLDVTHALASIAGDQVAGSVEEWRQWWEAQRLSFTPNPEKTAAYRREYLVQDVRVRSLGSFYDLDIYSDRLVFVLDTSMSMRGEKIASLKTNLAETLQTLQPNVQYNVVDFGGHMALMKPGSLITGAETPLVIHKVGYMTLTLGTRSYDAMELAMLLRDVDTIILLSDGAPVAGKFDDWPRILSAIRVYNRYRPIAVYGLEFSAGKGNVDWMAALARQNAGKCRSPQP